MWKYKWFNIVCQFTVKYKFKFFGRKNIWPFIQWRQIWLSHIYLISYLERVWVTLYFKVSLLMFNYTFKYWVTLINFILTIGLGLGFGLGLLASNYA